jgi:RNA polymerase sigma-70 factor (ECF subfamily)
MGEARDEGQGAPADRHASSGSEFDRLYRESAPRVRALCRYLLGSHEAAEDAVSEVYLKARQGLALYDPRRSFAAWITSIARHHCFDILRRRRVEARLFTRTEIDADALPDGAGPTSTPLAGALARESRQALRGAIERLPPRYRLPLVLRYYEELSYDEIARELELTRQDVATLLFRGKHMLRAALGGGAAAEDA